MSSITTSAIDTPSRRSVERTCDDLAILVLGVVGLIASVTFRDYGLGWDDYTHAEYADLLLRMYGSGFKDTGALSFANLYMYGGGFDMAAALLHKVIPLELFETRRLLGAVVGVIGLAVTWRLGRRVGGPLAGLAALLLLPLCPPSSGHPFLNPTGSPFSAAVFRLAPPRGVAGSFARGGGGRFDVAVAKWRVGPPKDLFPDADAGRDLAVSDRDGKAPRALQRNPAFCLRNPADDRARG